MLSDGSFYIDHNSNAGIIANGFYYYAPGQGSTFLGEFPEAGGFDLIATSSDELYAVHSSAYDHYYKFDGTTFVEYPITGLPALALGTFYYTISQNEYLYAIVGFHQIFRSDQPLADINSSTDPDLYDTNGNYLLDFSLSPNPASEYIVINIAENDLTRVTDFEWTNQLGQVLDIQPNNTGNLVFDISGLNSGVYFLTLMENGKRIGHKRFVKVFAR
jgi:hypothetical protein